MHSPPHSWPLGASRGGLGVWQALPPALLRWMPADSWGYFGPLGSAEGTARGALTPDSRKEFPWEFGKPPAQGSRGRSRLRELRWGGSLFWKGRGSEGEGEAGAPRRERKFCSQAASHFPLGPKIGQVLENQGWRLWAGLMSALGTWMLQTHDPRWGWGGHGLHVEGGSCQWQAGEESTLREEGASLGGWG